MMALLETAPPAERPPAGAAALHALAAAAAFGIFGFYLATAYPTLSSYRDSGDMAASALTLGVAHPPGYPFFTLISRAWLAVFRLGNVAYRLHVFSAACGAGACLTIFLAFLRAGRRSQTGSHIGAGLCAAFLLAFAPAFRHLSVVSEMYSLNALLTALLFALIFRAGDDASPRELCAAALLLAPQPGPDPGDELAHAVIRTVPHRRLAHRNSKCLAFFFYFLFLRARRDEYFYKHNFWSRYFAHTNFVL